MATTLKQQIQETKTYKGMSKMLRELFVKKRNVEHIEHALNVINNIGFEKWSEISNYRHNSVLVIKEILKID